MPLGTEVDLGPGHILLDVIPALRETGTAAPIISARVYYGHGRPSQLLLSSFVQSGATTRILCDSEIYVYFCAYSQKGRVRYVLQ